MFGGQAFRKSVLFLTAMATSGFEYLMRKFVVATKSNRRVAPLASVVLGLLIAPSSALAIDCFTPREWLPRLHMPLEDDDNNFIADAIENIGGFNVDVVVHLNQCPTQDVIARLVDFGDPIFISKYLSVVTLSNVNSALLPELARDPAIAFLGEDHEIFPHLNVSNPAVGVRPSSTYSPNTVSDAHPGIDGSGVNVAIMDTGVDDGVHSDLPSSRFIAGYDACLGLSTNPDDQYGHGTHVASTVLGSGGTYQGIAPAAGIVDVQVFKPGCTTTDTVVFGALEWIMDNQGAHQIKVLNFSGGDCTNSNGLGAFSMMFNRLVYQGIVAVVSKGNNNTQFCPTPLCSVFSPSPGSADDAITVANIDDMGTVTRADDDYSCSSMAGPRPSDGDLDTDDEIKPEIGAPGTNIGAAAHNTAASYVNMSGTSMSAPHVAGCAALLLEANPGLTPLSLKELLLQTAEDIPIPPAGIDDEIGYGELDCFAAVDGLISGQTADVKFEFNMNRPAPPYPWLSPDLVPTNPAIVEGTANIINATITNDGPGAANNVKVNIGIYNFGNSDLDYHICTVTVPSLASGASTTVSCAWTPLVSGAPPGTVHACLKAEVIYPYDTDFTNNKAQHNINIQQTFSPASFNMQISNPTNEDLTIIVQDNLDTRVAPGWKVLMDTATFAMAADECPVTQTIQLEPCALTDGETGPPCGPEGRTDIAVADIQIIGVRANGEQLLLGGATLQAQTFPVNGVPMMSRLGLLLFAVLMGAVAKRKLRPS
jgi:serine protease AprX